MSKLYGKITSDTSKATRASQKCIETWVQTEYGRITTFLSADGQFYVVLNRVYSHNIDGPAEMLCQGNANRQTVLASDFVMKQQTA